MDELNNDPIQGTLDFLILHTLRPEPMHDFAIEQRIEQKTRGLFTKLKLSPGSFLTALQRLERAGWLRTEWRQTENSGPEKIYSLTVAGKEQLEAEWTQRRSALAQFVESSGLDDSFRKFLNRNTNSNC